MQHNNKPLAQLAHDGQMLGTYEAQSRSVHEIREDSRIDRNAQLSSGVELCKGSNIATKQKIQLLDAILRIDLNSFIHKTFNHLNSSQEYEANWHIDLITHYLQALTNGEIRRLIINIPPRCLKSSSVSVAWPAWLLGHEPTKKIIVASYSMALSIKHSLDCRFVMASPWYQRIFPNTIISKKQNQKNKFLTTMHGFRMASSIGSTLTGEGGDILIIDDPHNPAHIHSVKTRNRAIEWFEQVFASRLNDKKNGVIILIMQRLHSQDLAGYLSNLPGWEKLIIPNSTTQEIRYSIPYYQKHQLDIRKTTEEVIYKANSRLYEHETPVNIENLISEIGYINYCTQYLQQPPEERYSLLHRKEIVFYDVHELPTKFDFFAQSWDTAIKVNQDSDYSVCLTFGVHNDRFYLLQILRDKLTYPNLKQLAVQTYQAFAPRFVIIEDKGSGQQLIQDMLVQEQVRREAIAPFKPKLDKITRFSSVILDFQSGNILLPKNAPHIETILYEIENFPYAKHDDIIDAFSQFLIFMRLEAKKMNCIARIRSF
ncbi:Terminase-like family protein [Rickettsiales endosymbiont of Paramecium tredecaurelia]|nr:Terminase-like family protein [Candidatus Sarmatiella mevalonica]